MTTATSVVTANSEDVVPIEVEFGGGLEILFSNQSKHNIALPAKNKDGSPANMKALVTHLCENTMTDHRKELFVLKGDDGYEVRPGIIVLIGPPLDESDWELEGEMEYEFPVKGDRVVFISTLHGG
ncbi:ubiquitin-related modifier 1 [Phyllosticta capitalensis]|uniref:Ubiquitin-related modifier 1 n=1 Tax=Phyllosticta capitalensis TaxID=121624 RepID=A0ABR1YLD0_9PEZI